MIGRSTLGTRYPAHKLADLVDFLDSQRRPVTESDRVPGPFPYYGANGVQGSIDKFLFDEPLVLLAEDGGHFSNPDRGVAYRISGKTWVNNHAHVLRPKPCIDGNFLSRVLENYDVTPFVTGTTRGKLTKAGASEIIVPLPPLPEQRRIAAIFDQADALRAKRREALAQLDSLTQSIFIEMFGAASTDQLGWPKLSLAEAADVLTGYAFKSDEFVDLGSSTVRLCRGTNVMPGRVDWQDLACWPKAGIERLSSFVLEAGDIVMAMDRPWISEGFKIARITPSDCPALLVQRVARVRARVNAVNDFLYRVLMQPAFAQHCRPTETTIPHISPREIRSFELRLPPLALQQTFAARIQAIEALKTTHCAALAELDALFASLQHRAFSGGL